MDLAPLEPDAFFIWCWETGQRRKGTHPHTLGDLFFEYVGQMPELDLATVRGWFVRVASKVRRNQRLGLDPWEGLGG